MVASFVIILGVAINMIGTKDRVPGVRAISSHEYPLLVE